eukprot:TRINITY_DN2672_c0_g1_i1.p1 TRINITY_DN2672_c0_g1~~TRINITY_DN2672_c0_g1_i1.p1  ORF type:complete len:339 (+),score=70.34 TRINITY_DN2672_c0_g1_i1:57-1019(+)
MTDAAATSADADALSPSGELWSDIYAKNSVTHASEYFSSRGLKLFTQSWLPAGKDPKALLFMCHGYANDTSWGFQFSCIKFASLGYGVFAMDYEGHGRSDGVRCGINRIDAVVDDCYSYFQSVWERESFKGLKTFIYGESLGGAMAIKIVWKAKENEFSGMILSAPMCKISDSIRPHWILVNSLKGLAFIFPNAAIVPTKDIISLAFRDKQKMEVSARNPLRYTGKPRLGFSLQLLNVTQQITENMEKVTVPFLIIHGAKDVITDPESSKELHRRAASSDKTLKLYPESFHTLLTGEPDDTSDVIWQDVLDWLHTHAANK